MTLWEQPCDDGTDLRVVLRPSGTVVIRAQRGTALMEVELTSASADTLGKALQSMATRVERPSVEEAWYRSMTRA